MEIRKLLKRFAGVPIAFEDLYYLATKIKKIYTNKEDFEIDLERALDENLVGIVRIQNENRFFAK